MRYRFAPQEVVDLQMKQMVYTGKTSANLRRTLIPNSSTR